MRSIKIGKIVFDKNLKVFRGTGRQSIYSFEDIRLEDLFSIGLRNEDIIKEYDDSYKKNIDVWEIEVVMQTKT